MQHSPIQQILCTIVRPVVASPTGNTAQVPPLVEVVFVELAARQRLSANQFALQ